MSAGLCRAAEPAHAQSAPAAAVDAALAELRAWLGAGDNRQRWEQYLQLALLDDQLASDAPDPAAIGRVLGQFRSEANGLEMRRFAAVRDALADWQRQLQSQIAATGDLARLAEASAGDYQPVTAAEERAARGELRRRAAQLQQSLGGQAAAWQAYLQWELLQPVLADEALPTRRQLLALADVSDRLYANHPGLELPAFTKFRQALDEYRAVAPWRQAAEAGRNPAENYEVLAKNLAGQLERLAQQRTTETPWLASRVLGAIDELGDSPELVAAVRAAYAQPNLYAVVSGDFVNAIPRKPVDTTRPVHQDILGTHIIGTSRTLATVRFEPVPWDDAIALVARFQGHAYARTNGYNGPVRIRSTSTTALSGVKRIHFSDAGFVTGAAVTDAETQAHIHSINKTGGQFGHKLIEKIAWNRAGESQGDSERIGARNAAEQLRENYDMELAAAVAEGRASYEQNVRAPLRRQGFFPEILRMSSTSSDLRIVAALAKRSQLGADGPPPPYQGNHDLSLRLHESAVDNYLAVALGGVRLSQDAADAPLKVTGSAPPWLKKATAGKALQPASPPAGGDGPALGADAGAPPFKPWSLTLNSEAPAGVTFEDGQLRIRLRAVVLASEEDEYRNWDILICYRVTQQGDRVVLVRTGDIEALPSGFDPAWDKRMAGRDSAFRNTLAKNMTARAEAGQGFPAEIDIPAINIAGLGRLHLSELVSADHWLSLGWQLP
ncbi:MAG: hypothetical protein KDA44_08170 [Planctomycetales bacterium]|nr:hypothetical protein [Planctomycetales bacterium]